MKDPIRRSWSHSDQVWYSTWRSLRRYWSRRMSAKSQAELWITNSPKSRILHVVFWLFSHFLFHTMFGGATVQPQICGQGKLEGIRSCGYCLPHSSSSTCACVRTTTGMRCLGSSSSSKNNKNPRSSQHYFSAITTFALLIFDAPKESETRGQHLMMMMSSCKHSQPVNDDERETFVGEGKKCAGRETI